MGLRVTGKETMAADFPECTNGLSRGLEKPNLKQD